MLEPQEIKQFIHDCRTPLVCIDTALSMLRDYLTQNAAQEASLQVVLENAKEQSKRINQMLNDLYQKIE